MRLTTLGINSKGGIVKQVTFWILIFVSLAFAADDQLLQQALKENALARTGKLDVVQFDNYSSRTQVKLNAKLSTVTFKAYTSTGREVAGTATALDAAHLGAFAHGDIAHANRAALDLVSGTNTGDQAPLIAGTDYLAPTGSAALLTGFPTLNQNTTGTSGGLTGTPSISVNALTATSITSIGSLPAFVPRAWVNFDSAGTIRAGGNVSSVGHPSTGFYVVNFITPMPDVNYAAIVSTDNVVTNTNFGVNVNTYLTTSVSIYCIENGAATDKTNVSVVILR